MTPENDLPPNDPPAPPAPVPAPASTVTCEFCKCQLTPKGDYISLSDRAKKLRGQEDELDTLRGQLAAAQEARTVAERERDEARAALAQAAQPTPPDTPRKLDIRW